MKKISLLVMVLVLFLPVMHTISLAGTDVGNPTSGEFPFEFNSELSTDGSLIVQFFYQGAFLPDNNVSLVINEQGKKEFLYNDFLKGKNKELVIKGLEYEKIYFFNVNITSKKKNTNTAESYNGQFIIQGKADNDSGSIYETKITILNVEKSRSSDSDGSGEIGILAVIYESEPNDSFSTADRIYDDDDDNYGYISSYSDVDYYKIIFSSDGNANFWLGSIPSGTDYDLYVYDQDYNQIAYSINGSNYDELISQIPVQANQWYYIKVESWSGYDNYDSYHLRVKNYLTSEQPDPYEPNDSFTNATSVSKNSTTYANIHNTTDQDYYKFYIANTSSFNLSLTDIPSGTDYDIKVYDGSQSYVAGSFRGSNYDEAINLTLNPGYYYIYIYPYSGYSNENYKLTISAKTVPVVLIPGLGGSVFYTIDTKNTSDSGDDVRSISWLRLSYQNTHIQERLLLNNSSGTIQPNNPRYIVEVFSDNYGLDGISDLAPETYLFGQEKQYEALINDLTNKGYSVGSTLFGFPYDWRQDNQTQAVKLKGVIDQALSASGADQVILVSHSMGGLATKNFLQTYTSYQDKIHKWITLGSPHLGAGKTVKALINGYDLEIPWVTEESGLYLAMHSPAVYQLIPSEQYYGTTANPVLSYVLNGVRTELNTYADVVNALSNVHFGQSDSYLNFQESLEDLAQNLHSSWDYNFSSVRFYQIVGENISTPFGFKYDNNVSSVSQLVNEDPNPIFVSGDGTVPVVSANAVGTNNMDIFYTANVSHLDLLRESNTRTKILNIIDGKDYDPVSGITSTSSTTAMNYTALTVPLESESSTMTTTLDSGEQLEIDIKDNKTYEVKKEVKGIHISKYGKKLWIVFPENKNFSVNWTGKANDELEIFNIKNSKYEKNVKVKGNKDIKSFKVKAGKVILEDDGLTVTETDMNN